ncbi:primase-helicase family protein [Maricaulaceae bacterium MS644]
MSKHYTIEELHLIVETIIGPSKPRQLMLFSETEVVDNEPQDVPFTNIQRGCKAAHHLTETAAHHVYDQWVALAQLFNRIKNGRQLFHQISSAYSNYDYTEADRKFDEARHHMKPPTCRRMDEVTGGEACRGCAFFGTVNSPMALPHLPDAVVEIMSQYVAVVNPPLFAHVETGERYTDKSFEQKFSHLSPKSKITTLIVKSRFAGKVESIVYRPGQPTGILLENGTRVLNIWRDTGIEPVHGNYGKIYQHLTYLLPDPVEREHVIDYFAHLVQKPGVKIKHVILIIGGQGIGKSAIGLLLKLLVGSENAKEVGPSEAEDRFKARWGNLQVLIFEELMATDRLKFYNELKDWITNETATAEEKHIQAYKAATPRGFLAFSNEQIPTRLATDDRRFFVVRSEMTPQPAAYYDELFEAINGMEAGAFKDHLLNRDISGFRPDARPPMTAAKADLIADTRAPIETKIEALIEAEQGVFSKDLVTLEAVGFAAHDYGERKPSHAAVGAALRSLGHKPYPTQVRLHDGTRPRLWVIRDHVKWLQADPEEIRKELIRS